jgi:hypothetical protein
MDRILGQILRRAVWERLGELTSSIDAHEHLACAETVRARLWSPQQW